MRIAARLLIGLSLPALLAISTSPARAQFLLQDVEQELADQSQLRNDVAGGNLLGAAGDLLRLQFDNNRLQFDQQLLQNGVAGSQAYAPFSPWSGLVPHPQYPGYYYAPSNPGQLYYNPTQPLPAQQPPLGPVPAPPPVGPVANGLAPNLPPAVVLRVNILNPETSGVPINYAVDGTPYSTPSGSVERLEVRPRAQIIFDRGAAAGPARYTLSNGDYEFRYTDQGWDLFRHPVAQQAPFAGIAANQPPRENVPPPPRPAGEENPAAP